MDVLLGPKSDVDGMLPEKLKQLRSLCGEMRDIRVPSFAPNTREQFDSWGSIWPLNFRPPQVSACRIFLSVCPISVCMSL